MHVRKARQGGVDALVKAKGGTAKELNLFRLQLQSGSQEGIGFDKQKAVLVHGEVELTCGDNVWQARRADPFQERASALCLPPGSRATVKASAASEVVVATTRCNEQGEPVFVSPEDVTVKHRGGGDHAREARDFFVSDSQGKRLMGETFNPPGSWWSFPPYKHDGEEGKPYLDEVYDYRKNQPKDFGYQARYAKMAVWTRHPPYGMGMP